MSPVAALRERLAALDAAYTPGHHGRWSARRRASFADEALGELWASAGPPAGSALAALGGYGRGELAPRSDLDLLILHGGRDGAVRDLAERLLYPLWDAGFAVGHAVRTVKECLAEASRLDSLTALLDARLLAGDEGPFSELRDRILARVRKEGRAFLERLREEAHRRHERHGSAAHLLEPDLKEGSGGLRDVHTLGWAARALTDGGWVDGLVSLGALRPRERDALADAEEYLTRLRGALHVETGRKTDRLPLELQPALAEAMGFEDEPGLPAVDGLMRATFEHARQVEHAVRLAFDRLLSPGSAVRSGEAEPAEPLDGFEGILEALAQAAESGRALLPVELDRIEATDPGVAERWSPGMREGFLRLLRAGRDGTRMLEALDRAGLLVRLLPEWGPVRCRPQRDPYHRFTVDVHLLETSANARALLDRGATDDPVAVEAAGAVEEVDGLLLGALLHDVGKTGEGRHVPVGARVAAAALDRTGVVGRTRELARFLVEDHLLLSDTATRRDITDEDLVLGVAARVRDQERLAALYLLALADGRATGPHAWTPWRSGLVRELVAKVQRVLERGQMGDEAADRLAAREREIREALAGEPADAVELFLARLPRSYLLAVDAERAARHFGLLDSPLGLTEVRTLTGPGEGTGTHALAVVTRDRPGLLARIAGALALSGLSILSAQVFTTEDGVAVDLFEVEGAFEREVTEERWRSFRALLRKAVEDRVSLEHRVREKRSYYRPPRADIPLKVRVDNESSDFFTVVEVSAADRIGLLYDITQAFAELGLDVHLAKVATYGVRVVDAFYVRDALGERILHPARVGEIERAVAARLGPAEELEQG